MHGSLIMHNHSGACVYCMCMHFDALPTHFQMLLHFKDYLFRISQYVSPVLPSFTSSTSPDLTRGHFNDGDGLTAIESAQKLPTTANKHVQFAHAVKHDVWVQLQQVCADLIHSSTSFIHRRGHHH